MKRILLVLVVMMSAVQPILTADIGGDRSGRLQVSPVSPARPLCSIEIV